VEEAGEGLVQEVVLGGLRRRPGAELAVGGAGHIDQPRVQFGELAVSDSQTVEISGSEALDQDVRPGGQPPDQLLPLRPVHIDADVILGVVHPE